ncbi:hypothetical protein LPW36_05580 [Jinshanibacter sp. LJY008]|uniref:Uncharacterized protein n=1 Tax=Limnobaculum eriocheiris TaxID=2897391 RepID=A0A9X1MVU6_9GAMM|nr:hypothetical protein [Limnobaculum eriocheiris]MCD1125488.1 hypothetical protein [Limnobaculum eriocheiris]
MKIREEDQDIADIYAIYWFGKEQFFLGLPRNYGGLRAYKAEEVKVIDTNINFMTVYFHNNAYGIYHWALIKENLLADLLELDETAYKRFLEILKAEGQIDSDFY